jgi:hypothetical protein
MKLTVFLPFVMVQPTAVVPSVVYAKTASGASATGL